MNRSEDRIPKLRTRGRANRRKLLRYALRGAALAALTPTLGSSMLSEFFVPGEIHAFEEAEARLAKLGSELGILLG